MIPKHHKGGKYTAGSNKRLQKTPVPKKILVLRPKLFLDTKKQQVIVWI